MEEKYFGKIVVTMESQAKCYLFVTEGEIVSFDKYNKDVVFIKWGNMREMTYILKLHL